MPSLDLPSWLHLGSGERSSTAKNDGLGRLNESLSSLPPDVQAFAAVGLGSVTTVASILVYRRYFRRLASGDWITPDMFARKKWIKGVVTSVGDADNFRLYHTPGFGWRWPLKFRNIPTANKDLKNQTIHIRIGGVDAPEGAHFGRPAQPYAAEALAWLKAKLDRQRVYCQLIQRDQYGRIVANVTLPPRILPGTLVTARSLAMDMLDAGWVTVYEQSGAVYGPWGKEAFLRAEAKAQAAKKGIWEKGTKGESPAEYKARWAAGGGATASNIDEAEKAASTPRTRRRKKGWLKFWPWSR